MDNWKTVGVVVEGERINIGGVNPWSHEWKSTGQEPIQLPHPTYPAQMHTMDIYQIETAGRNILFAAGELSANVWGFYVPA
jgi:succinate dehydrogenase/fumarate reductase flavoprotein subunit